MPYKYHIFRTWIWELVSVALAVGLVNAIAILLATYNGQRADSWSLGINFNALLAILSTILRAVLVVIVSQVISQRKWDWFREGRVNPLSDLQQFDSGSRGSIGALLLIPTVLRRDFVTLVAAVVFFATFLVGPFVQLASRTAECKFPVQGQNASIPFAHYVPRQGGFRPFTGNGYGIPTADTVVAIMSALTASRGVENQVSISCGTGNCTFPGGDPGIPQDGDLPENDHTTHSTVGMCSKCANIKSLISRKNISDEYGGITYMFTLPNGLNVNLTSGGSIILNVEPSKNLTWMRDALPPELRSASRWAYVNVTFLATPSRDNSSQAAAVCSLYPCLRTYISNITDNQLIERQTHSTLMQVDVGPYGALDLLSTNGRNNYRASYTAVKSPCRVGESIYDASKNMSFDSGGTKLFLYDFSQEKNGSGPYQYNITAPEQCIYRQNAEHAAAISTILSEEVFSGNCSSYKGPKCRKKFSQISSGYLPIMPDIGVDTVLQTLWNNGDMRFSDIELWFETFATAMTNRFRVQYGASGFNQSKIIQERGMVGGLAWRTTSCISMRWEWLLLPSCLTLITAALSLWTITTNWQDRNNRPVWKDSIMPFIFYGHKIKSEESEGLMRRASVDSRIGDYELPREQNSDSYTRVDEEPPKQQNTLLEASKMKDMSKDVMISFRWAHGTEAGSGEGGSNQLATGLQKENSWLRRRNL